MSLPQVHGGLEVPRQDPWAEPGQPRDHLQGRREATVKTEPTTHVRVVGTRGLPGTHEAPPPGTLTCLVPRTLA
eukprot:6905837-Lingulodinium_polyedra.AAC.1